MDTKKQEEIIARLNAESGVVAQEYDPLQEKLVEIKDSSETETKDEGKENDAPDTGGGEEPERPSARKKTKRKTKKKVQPKEIPADDAPTGDALGGPKGDEDTRPTGEDDDTGEDTGEDIVKDKKRRARGGPNERRNLREETELRHQQEIERLEERFKLQQRLHEKELGRRRSDVREVTPTSESSNSIHDFTNRALVQYRDGLKNALDSGKDEELYDIENNKVTREQAERLLRDADDSIRRFTSQPEQPSARENVYDDPGLPIRSRFADQTSAEYTKRVELSHKFEDLEMNPNYVEEIPPNFVNAISTLSEEDQSIVVAGLGDKIESAPTDKQAYNDLMDLGNYWGQATNPYDLVARVRQFKDEVLNQYYEYQESLGEEPEPEEDPIKHKPAGKPVKGSASDIPSHEFTGTIPDEEESDQEYFNRMQKEHEKKIKRRFGVR